MVAFYLNQDHGILQASILRVILFRFGSCKRYRLVKTQNSGFINWIGIQSIQTGIGLFLRMIKKHCFDESYKATV